MKPDLEIKVRPFRNWHIASCNSVKATGTTRTEAIAHLLLSLRNEVEVVEIRIEPIGVGSGDGDQNSN